MEEDEGFRSLGDRSRGDELLWSGFAQDESQRTSNRTHGEASWACQCFFAIENPGNEAAILRMMVVVVRRPCLWLCASPRMPRDPK